MWSDPEVETVAPGVHRAPVPLPADGLRAVNVYVVEDGDGVVLVDSGWDGPEARAAVDAGLAAAGAGIGDVSRMLITHLHYDHIGQATALRQAGAGEYWLGVDEKDGFTRMVAEAASSRMDRMDQLESLGAVEMAEAGRRSRHGMPEVQAWEPPDRWLADGDQTMVAGHPVTAVATPGHTRGHLCFLDTGRRLLFSGDHVLPHITPSIGLEPETNRFALVQFLASLAAVRSLDVALVLPAHGEVFTDLAGRVDELTAHHDVRLAACMDAVGPAGAHPFAVASALPWTRRETPFAELDGFNRVLAIWETAAHLELLAARGDLVRSVESDTVVFRRPAPASADPPVQPA